MSSMASNLEHEKPVADVEEQPSTKKIKVDDDNVSVESAEEDKADDSTKDSAEDSAEDQADEEDKQDGDDTASDKDDDDASESKGDASKPASTTGFGGFKGFSGFSGFASFKQSGSTGFGGFAAKASESGSSAFTFTAGTSGFDKPVEKKAEPAANVTALTEAELANGEEDEQLVVERRGKLFKFVDKDFTEVGIGPFRLLKAKDASGDDAAKASARIVMRRESYPRGPGTKLILNARLTACVSCVKKTEKSLMLVIVEPSDDGKLKPVTYLFRFGAPEDLAAVQNSIVPLLPAHATTSATSTEASASS
ncbi:hypothetical protein PINS_up005821 [Pythium insidiosum]|nr:hypothetical protein PINS_up005821 [Pythium insidiosum]